MTKRKTPQLRPLVQSRTQGKRFTRQQIRTAVKQVQDMSPTFKTPFYGIVCHVEPQLGACVGKSVVSYVVFGSATGRGGRAAWIKRDKKHHFPIEPGQLFGPGYFDNGCGIGYLDPFNPETIDWETGKPKNGWDRIKHPTCDLCSRPAVFRRDGHLGIDQLRCETCPRQEGVAA